MCTTAVPGQPSVTVDSITETNISISWSVPRGSIVYTFEVMWETKSSQECFDKGSIAMNGSFTSYTIMGVEESTNYTITVKASNAAGSAVSDPVVIRMTHEAGE